MAKRLKLTAVLQQIGADTSTVQPLILNCTGQHERPACPCRELSHSFAPITDITLRHLPEIEHIYDCAAIKLIRRNRKRLKRLCIGSPSWQCKNSLEGIHEILTENFRMPELEHLEVYVHPQHIVLDQCISWTLLIDMKCLRTLNCPCDTPDLPYMIGELTEKKKLESATIHIRHDHLLAASSTDTPANKRYTKQLKKNLNAIKFPLKLIVYSLNTSESPDDAGLRLLDTAAKEVECIEVNYQCIQPL